METKSIMIVGVGGQGTLLASRLIGNALISTGSDVKLSEVHGMSQRGGSVVTYVKYGDAVRSPLIDLGEADYILSFEALEAGRFLPYLKKGGTIITNTQHILPMPVITGQMAYPETVLEALKAKANVIAVDALAARSSSRICSTIQIADTGIAPGSGVGNHQKALTRETLGAPVIAVGVPTVADAADPASDGGTLFVTPRYIDSAVRALARVIGYGIDLALHDGLTVGDIDLLVG